MSIQLKKNKSPNSEILHVINIYFSLSYLGDQFKYFSKKGYKQHLICSPSENLMQYGLNQGVKIKDINIIRKISPMADVISLFKILRYILDNKIGIVVGHTPKGALLSMMGAYIMRVPKRIYFRHGLVYETMLGFPRTLMINVDRLTAFCATQVVCVSPSVAQQSLLDKLNSEKKQIVLGRGTCGGVDANEKFNPNKIDKNKVDDIRKSLGIDGKAFVIGFCGRLVRDKGIVELVTGFNLLKSKFPNANIKLLLIGDFEERDSLPKDIKKEIIINPSILYTGFIYNSIQHYYSLMSIFVLPSFREGFPTVILEASSMELTVLTTKVTGCVDSVLDGVTGFFVENTPESIAIGISNLMNDSTIKQYGINGRKMVLEHFENDKIWELIESELYCSTN